MKTWLNKFPAIKGTKEKWVFDQEAYDDMFPGWEGDKKSGGHWVLSDNARNGLGGVYSHCSINWGKFDIYPDYKLIKALKENFKAKSVKWPQLSKDGREMAVTYTQRVKDLNNRWVIILTTENRWGEKVDLMRAFNDKTIIAKIHTMVTNKQFWNYSPNYDQKFRISSTKLPNSTKRETVIIESNSSGWYMTETQYSQFNDTRTTPGLYKLILSNSVPSTYKEKTGVSEGFKKLDDAGHSNTMAGSGGGWGCFKSGTLVEMFDGTHKNIEKIKEGEIVKSYKDGKYTSGIVTKHLIHPINKTIPIAIIDDIVGSTDHPVFVDGKWYETSESPLNVKVTSMYIDNWYNLEVDGHTIYDSEHNYIIKGHIMSGLGDHKVLNDVFQRQNCFKTEDVEF